MDARHLVAREARSGASRVLHRVRGGHWPLVSVAFLFAVCLVSGLVGGPAASPGALFAGGEAGAGDSVEGGRSEADVALVAREADASASDPDAVPVPSPGLVAVGVSGREGSPTTTAQPRVPDQGSDTWSGAAARAGANIPDGKTYRVAVRTEKDLRLDADAAARFVIATLQDERSWQGVDGVRFVLVPWGEPADVTVSIATPGTTDRLCAPLDTHGELSCRTENGVTLNARRWTEGAAGFGSIETYRQHLVNHEVGHALGHEHEKCAGPNQVAPVMMQQTKGLDGCRANAWPAAKA